MHASQSVKPNKHERYNKAFNTSSWAKTRTQKRVIILKVLKVAHEQFTSSGGEIPHIGRHGGHNWQNFAFLGVVCTSRAHTQYRWRLARDWEWPTKRSIMAIIMHSDKTLLIKE